MTSSQMQQLIASAKAGEAKAQFLLSRFCLQSQDTEGMIHWLREASARGHADAMAALGHCFEIGQGVGPDMNAALSHYDSAYSGGSRVAAFHRAQLLYKSRSGPKQAALIRDLLLEAASLGLVPALRTVAYLAMQHESTRPFAISCLQKAAASGDPVSCFNLGWCYTQGWCEEMSAADAASLFAVSRDAGYPLAASMLQSIDASARACALREEEDIDFDVSFPIYPLSEAASAQEISADPAIRVFKNVLNAADRAYLVSLSRPFLQPAAVINPKGNKDGMVSRVRTNQSTFIPFELVDIISRYAELKIVGRAGEDLSTSEPMSILRYANGEYYKPHFDFFNPKLDVSREFMQNGGQRIASAVTYLVAPQAGGGTSFPKLDITVAANSGDTLWFRNCLANGEVDERSLHAGDEVEAGEKWVLTKWFREQETDYLQI